MSDRILVGTRKGLFRIAKTGTAWSITDSWFLGDSVSMVLSEPDGQRIHAALGLGHFGVKLQRSEDGGASWTEVNAPEYPPKPEGFVDKDPMRGIDIPWSSQLIWALERGDPGELWCGDIPGGLFRSTDGGDSWMLIRSLWDDPRRQKWVGGGYDFAGIHSIVVDPRDSNHITVGVSVGGVWSSWDRGETWELLGDGLRAEYMPPDMANDPISQDPHRIAQCIRHPDRQWTQHHNGIFVSDDAGRNWRELENVKPSGFGFAVAAHPIDPDIAWFVPAVKDETRIPVDGQFVVTRTKDGGKTVETLRNGLPEGPSYDLVFRHALDVAPDGERLAVGSTTGSLWISDDQGDYWQTISTHLPPVHCIRFED